MGQTTGNPIIGKRRDAEAMGTLQDPWAEAPFFAPPSKTGKESEHITVLNEGDAICAVFHGMRESKNDVAAKRRKYAVLQTEDGERLRLFTPGQLAGILKNVAQGSYVEITYRGREAVEGYDDPLHQFDVLVGKEALN